jgi:hypothetical protein
MRRLLFAFLALLTVPAWAQNAPIVLTEGNRPSYCTVLIGNTLGAGAGNEFFYIAGAAGKAVRITSVEVGGSATAATLADLSFVRRSTAFSGGTIAALTPQKMDLAADPTASASPNVITAAATPGTLVGVWRGVKFLFGTAAVPAPPYYIRFGVNNDRAFVLRGTTDIFSLAFSAAPAGASVDLNVCWVEE